jgi:hypothetical protein
MRSSNTERFHGDEAHFTHRECWKDYVRIGRSTINHLQRALSGDPGEVIAAARKFLERNSFAVYCDSVLIPALQLAAFDHEAGLVDTDQESTIRGAVIKLITNLSFVEAPQICVDWKVLSKGPSDGV